MARSEAVDVFISRLLAVGLSFLSAYFSCYGLGGGFIALIMAQTFAVPSVLVLGSIRGRVGARRAYFHPMGVLTLLLLCPAQLVTFIRAVAIFEEGRIASV